MSLRFDRSSPPGWNARRARVDFICVDSQTRRPIACAVSRAALEDSTGEELDGRCCVAAFARHLGRIIAVANGLYAAHAGNPHGVVLVDSDDLLQHYPAGEDVIAAHQADQHRARAAVPLR